MYFHDIMSTQRKIAIIISELAVSGGTERQVIHLAHELTLLGTQVTVYTLQVDKNKCFPELIKDVSVISVNHKRKLPSCYTKIKIIGPLLYFWNEIRRCKALAYTIDADTDILNPHEQTSVRVAYYFKKKIRNIPSVWMFNDLTTASWSLFHDPLFGSRKVPFWKKVLNRVRDEFEHHRFFRSQNAIVAVSERARDIVRKEIGRDARVVRIGVDVDRISYNERKKPGNDFILLCHGIFYPHRRFEDIIRAVALLRDSGRTMHLQVIGDYAHRDIARTYHEELKALVRELRLERFVTFSGVVSDAELFESYQRADVFIASSHLQTWGISVFEAMSAGIPTIVSHTIGAAEVLRDGATALFIEPGNPASIARAVKKLADDAALYERLSKDGAAFVRDNFSWKRYAEEMLRVFEEVIL